jgi:hypothetical protein
MLPVYLWILVFVGYTRGGESPQEAMWDSVTWTALVTALAVLGAVALVQLVEFPFRSTASHSIFRLAVINSKGEQAAASHLLARWAIVWVPLAVPMSFVLILIQEAQGIAFTSALGLLLLWIAGAIYTVVHPHRGLHDRLAGTWVVRR